MQVIHKQLTGNLLHVSIIGEMDALGCVETRAIFESLVETVNQESVSLDLSDVSFLDSSGIGAIVFLFKRLKAKGSELTLSGANGQPAELLRLLRIDQAIHVEWDAISLTKAAS